MAGIFKAAFGHGAIQRSNSEIGWLSNIFKNTNKRYSDNYIKNLSAVYACRKQISESLSIFPIQIIKKIDKDKREVDTKHRLNDLLNLSPNGIMGAAKFRQAQTLNVLDEGDSFAEIEFERGTMRPKAIWPIPPGHCVPEVFYNKNKVDIRYRVLIDDGDVVYLPKQKILHIVGMSENGYKGEGVLDAAARTFGLGANLEEFASKFFVDGASGGGYVTIPGKLSVDAALNLRTKLEEMNSGLDNAHRFKFLMDGVTYTSDHIKNDQAQFLESRTFQVQEIARFYGMPLHKIQENSNGSYNSYEQLAIDYVNFTLQPFVKSWEQEIQRKLLRDSKDENYTVRFNLNALLRGDSSARASFYRTMIYTGVLTRNEVRSMEDFSAKPGADELLIPTNLTTQEAMEQEASGENDSLSNKQLDAKERTID